jgi:hypothetical protein
MIEKSLFNVERNGYLFREKVDFHNFFIDFFGEFYKRGNSQNI